VDRNVVVGTATKASDQNYSVKPVEDDDYTGLDTDKYDEIWGNPTTGDHTYTLPTSADNPNRIIKVRHIGDGTYDFDIAPDGSDTIGGYAANFKLNGVGQFVSLISDADNSNWRVGPCLGTLLEFTSAADVTVTSPSSGVWYNPTGHSLAITPGSLWRGDFKVAVDGYESTSHGWRKSKASLSTANNTIGPVDRSTIFVANMATGAANLVNYFHVPFDLTVAAATTLYLNICWETNLGGTLDFLHARGDLAQTRIQVRRIA